METSRTFNFTCLSSFCADYEYDSKLNKKKKEEEEKEKGSHFNKVGPNKHIIGMKGTYRIPYINRLGLSRDMFYKLCAYYLYYGKINNKKLEKEEYYINFAQYLPNVAPLCLDFDLVCNFTKEDRKKIEKKYEEKGELHIYDFVHISKIVEILNNIIFENFEIEKEEIKAYVLEKEEFKFKDKEVVKDGLHIIYLFPFSTSQRFFIRDELINKLKEIDFVKSFNFKITNSYEEIVDEAVIIRNPWLTYGSIKVETKKAKDKDGQVIYYEKNGKKIPKKNYIHSKSYNLTHIFDFDLYDENVDASGELLTYEEEEELEYLMNLFDLEQFSDDDPLDAKTEKAEEFIENWEREDEEKKERIKSYKSKSIGNNSISTNSNSEHQEKHERRIYDYNLNTEILLKMVEILKKKEFFYTDRNTWLKICCSLHKNFTDHKIPEEDIKNAILDFSKGWNSFNLSHFEEVDYPLILELANTKDYSLDKPLKCIKEIDQEKYDEINNFVNKKNKELTEEDLKPYYNFEKYKINNSEKSFTTDKKIDRVFNNSKLSKDENLDEIIFKEFKELEKYENEKQKEKIKDCKKETNVFEESEYPFDNEFKHIQKLIDKCKISISSKKVVENLLCKYIEQYIKKILKKDYFYCYEIKTGTYEMVSDRYLKNCIPDKTTFSMYDDYGKTKDENFNPLRIFSKYVELNGYNEINKLDYDNNLIKPRAYEETYYINGCEVKEKIFNNGPIIPNYLLDDYKPYNDYDEKYKSWVQDFFKLVRIGLCSNKQEEYEYLKNWIINKILLKRNETIVVLQSTSQGCGKSTVTLLFQEILGSRYVTSSNDCSWLYSTFNSVLENKVIYCIEETTQTKSSNEWFNASGKLKDFITNPKILITHKFHDTVECNNYIDFIVTSNNYKTMPLETENRRYFIPKVSSKDKEIDELTKKINSILKGKEHGEFKTREEKEIYYRCFFAYCNENYNKDFRPSNIPLTDAIIDNNEIRMPFEIKYMKIFNLYEKRDFKRDYDEETKTYKNSGTFKIIFKPLLKRLKEFYDKLNGNDKMIEKYNYCQKSLNNFNFNSMNNKREVILKQVKSTIYNSLKLDEKKYYDQKIRIPGYNGYPGIVISYDELLECYKKNGYIDDLEYEKLKGNYDKVDYCDNSSISEFSNSSTIEELKIQLEEKDELIKKYIEELKEKDNIIEGLKRFTNEKADKEIENLKSYNKELNDKLEELKNDLQNKLDIIKIKDDQIEKLEFDIKGKNDIINTQKETLDNEKKELEAFNEEKIKLENIIKDFEKDIKKNENENKNIEEIKDIMEKKIINYIEKYYDINHKFNICKEIVDNNKLTKKKLEKYNNFNALGIDEIIKQDEEIKEIKKELNEIFKI